MQLWGNCAARRAQLRIALACGPPWLVAGFGCGKLYLVGLIVPLSWECHMSISIPPLPGTTRDPLYPDSDGVPLGETDFHVLAATHLYYALKRRYRQQEDVYVAVNMLLYYEEGDPSKFRGPDVMVCKGVAGNHLRRSFRTWEEGVVPTVIFEVTSKKTRQEDKIEKPLVYAALGVKELFLFDPEGEYLRPRLQGFELRRRKYAPLTANADGLLLSKELGLLLEIEGNLLRLIDPATGKRLPTDEELADEAQQATLARREAKKAKRQAAKAKGELQAAKQRAAELEAELARIRGLPPTGGKNQK